MRKISVPFRGFIIYFVLFISVVTLLLSGTAIFLVRSGSAEKTTVARTREVSEEMARRTEGLLASVEQGLILLCRTSLLVPPEPFTRILKEAVDTQPMIRAFYVLDEQGQTTAVGTRTSDNPRDGDFLGIDFSNMPLYQEIQRAGGTVWSDKFISILSGDTSVGAGIRMGDRTVIAEMALETLLETVRTATGSGSRAWVIDGRGEQVADTGSREGTGVLSAGGNSEFIGSLQTDRAPDRVELDGVRYHLAMARSEKLGWRFLAGLPAGLDSPEILGTVTDLTAISVSFLIIALLLSPLWSFRVAGQLADLKNQADRMFNGGEVSCGKPGIVREFNELSEFLRLLFLRLNDREAALRTLNLELEQRVKDRTSELEIRNEELRLTLENLNRMQSLLIRTEKLAALGRLVAGIAHELNTPIGNAVMSVSSIREDSGRISRALEEGIRKSELDRFLGDLRHGLEIAQRNLDRAAELISSFKHVASDQTSSVRRKFDLEQTLREILLTLHPMLKRCTHRMSEELEPGIEMNSYPGVLGQIVTNLIDNSLKHAWGEGEHGELRLTARRTADRTGPSGEAVPMVRITVGDDGKGIPEQMGKKIFEPFVTTMMGHGGTGLGLNIAHNGARNVLGGELDFISRPGEGTEFFLDLPLTAPVITPDEGNSI